MDLGGEPIELVHGGPLRLIVPGWYGVANVKWLSRIHVQEEPFLGKYQARWYRTVRGEKGGGFHDRKRPMDDPDWMFDPNSRPTAPCPPGFMWAFGGNPMKWFQTERTAEAMAQQAAAKPAGNTTQ